MSFAHRVLVLFAHPALDTSRINRHLIEVPLSLQGITFRDLYQLYPDFDVDVRAEQVALSQHDVIVFHHPLYWYSVPPLVRQWQDLVLEHGWAFGHEGIALRNKTTLHVITAGAPETAYDTDGYNRYALVEFLRPFECTAALCGMDYLSPFVVFNTHCIGVKELQQVADDYRRLLVGLRDDTVDKAYIRAHGKRRLNADINAALPASAGRSPSPGDI